MEWADLGFPVLLAILVFFGIFAVSAIITSFVKKENRRDLKAFFHRLLDTGDKKQMGDF